MIRESFARASAKPESSSGTDFIEAILRERPDLRGRMVYFPDEGQLAHTAIIGDEVFKGPRFASQVGENDKEVKILRALEGKGLPVPEVTCVGKESVFFGMTRMPGVMIGSVFPDLSMQQKQALACDIADFVIGMARALPCDDGFFAMHDDMNEENLFVAPESGRLTAVIDFGIVMNVRKHELGPGGGMDKDLQKMVWQAMKGKRSTLDPAEKKALKVVEYNHRYTR